MHMHSIRSHVDAAQAEMGAGRGDQVTLGGFGAKTFGAYAYPAAQGDAVVILKGAVLQLALQRRGRLRSSGHGNRRLTQKCAPADIAR